MSSSTARLYINIDGHHLTSDKVQLIRKHHQRRYGTSLLNSPKMSVDRIMLLRCVISVKNKNTTIRRLEITPSAKTSDQRCHFSDMDITNKIPSLQHQRNS
ncbi:hypothetical protein J6590_046102 [Homalodisca vitripennis]|nr:hypothetical protein J6590_046102 [Homalodisca vitripennis]